MIAFHSFLRLPIERGIGRGHGKNEHSIKKIRAILHFC
jgi:hypothetical protein